MGPDTGVLITADMVTEIETLARRIGVDNDSESVIAATHRIGGSAAPYGYLLLTRSQALALIMLLVTYAKETEREQAKPYRLYHGIMKDGVLWSS